MVTNPDPEHPGTEIGAKKTSNDPSKDPFVVHEVASISEDTHGSFGPHSEFGSPPFNWHT